MKHHKTLQSLFSFPGFRASQTLHGKFGKPHVRIVKLVRSKKQPYVQTVIHSADHGTINQ